MDVNMDECPCSGKNMSNLAAPWILLTLFHHQSTHGYEIKKLIKGYLDGFSMDLNITGLYRHLNLLEERGMLSSQWDTTEKGPAKRRYCLTADGEKCLWRWLNTLSSHALLIGKFFDRAQAVFPSATLPTVRWISGTASPSREEKQEKARS